MAEQRYRLAVFGDPVAHSLSPTIHHRFGQQTGLSVDYRAQQVGAEALESALADFVRAGGYGLNLTVPHKRAGVALCRRLSSRAAAAGSVNTLLREAGGWYGDNTDGAGLMWDLEENLNWSARGRPLVLVGAGGAAAGVLPALLNWGWEQVLVVNRNLARAQQLAAAYPQRVVAVSLEVLSISPRALVINATAAGHRGACPPLPAISDDCLAYDLNYGPAAEPFLSWAAHHGVSAADGLGMLVGQAAAAFALWTGKTVQAQPVLAELSASLASTRLATPGPNPAAAS